MAHFHSCPDEIKSFGAPPKTEVNATSEVKPVADKLAQNQNNTNKKIIIFLALFGFSFASNIILM